MSSYRLEAALTRISRALKCCELRRGGSICPGCQYLIVLPRGDGSYYANCGRHPSPRASKYTTWIVSSCASFTPEG